MTCFSILLHFLGIGELYRSKTDVLPLSYQPPAAGPGAPVMQPMMGQSMMRPPFTGVAGVAPGAAAPGAPVTHHSLSLKIRLYFRMLV